jgi:hypothetical protein
MNKSLSQWFTLYSAGLRIKRLQVRTTRGELINFTNGTWLSVCYWAEVVEFCAKRYWRVLQAAHQVLTPADQHTENQQNSYDDYEKISLNESDSHNTDSSRPAVSYAVKYDQPYKIWIRTNILYLVYKRDSEIIINWLDTPLDTDKLTKWNTTLYLDQASSN